MKRLIIASLALLLTVAAYSQTKIYKLEVVAKYPHSTQSYTQGLFFNDGSFYESAGLYGKSNFRIVDLKSGDTQKKLDFSKKYFIEGSCILDGKLFILTWTNKLVFTYDSKTLKYLQSYSYPREGWGLTTDGKQLIASDGSNRIYFLDKELKLQRTINVTNNSRPVKYLNELEWIDGKIWANIYTTDYIAIINPQNGKVEGLIDCSELIPAKERTAQMDVLNGIAHNKQNGKTYLTGKNWPYLFEVKLKADR